MRVMVSGTQTSLLQMALKFYEESLSLIQPELSVGSSVDIEQKRKLGHDWAGEVVRLRDKPKWNDRLFTSGYSYTLQGHVLVRLLVTQKCKRNLDGTSSIEVCSVRVVFLWPVWSSGVLRSLSLYQGRRVAHGGQALFTLLWPECFVVEFCT